MPCITIEVKGKPELVCTDLKADKYTVGVNEPVKVTATIENRGDAEGSAVFNIEVNGEWGEPQTTPTLKPGESTTLTWTLQFPTPGRYEVCVYRV